MRTGWTILRIMHVTIEATTAIAVGAAKGVGVEDAPVYLDVHGLPQLPGTSIAGVLRALFGERISALRQEEALADSNEETERGTQPDEIENDLFGFASSSDAVASRIEISSGYVHGSDDRPAVTPDLDLETGLAIDPLLAWYQQNYRDQPSKRRRVRLNERGVADDVDKGLFDRTVVQKGTRFTFELAFWSEPGIVGEAEWGAVKDLLDDERLRFGAQTRAGLGAVKIIRRSEWAFDLGAVEGLTSYTEAFPALQAFSAGTEIDPPREKSPHCESSSAAQPQVSVFRLEPIDYWRIGGVETAVRNATDADVDEADLAPFTEEVVTWRATLGGNGGRAIHDIIERHLLIPGASIKGALRHRTAFHHARIENRFSDLDAGTTHICRTDEDPAVVDLFGAIKSSGGGHRGRVVIDDVTVPLKSTSPKLQTITHNAIDRFTGGVRSGFLFAEQMVWKSNFDLKVTVIPGKSRVSESAERALFMALADLCEGRLPLGAASGRGHGRVRGRKLA